MSDDDPTSYLSVDDILAIHELVVEANEDTEAGVSSVGDVEYVVETVQGGPFGHAPESIHEKAYQLLRLVVANHPFVDGNKRTALMSVRVFYALNGLEFDYDRQVKEFLKALATDESAVAADSVLAYLHDRTEPLPAEYDATIRLWLAQVERSPDDTASRRREVGEPNDYDRESRTDE